MPPGVNSSLVERISFVGGRLSPELSPSLGTPRPYGSNYMPAPSPSTPSEPHLCPGDAFRRTQSRPLSSTSETRPPNDPGGHLSGSQRIQTIRSLFFSRALTSRSFSINSMIFGANRDNVSTSSRKSRKSVSGTGKIRLPTGSLSTIGHRVAHAGMSTPYVVVRYLPAACCDAICQAAKPRCRTLNPEP